MKKSIKFNDKFEPDWIIELVKKQYPDKQSFISALEKCKLGKWDCKNDFKSIDEFDGYIYFVSNENANCPGAEWQICDGLMLTHKISRPNKKYKKKRTILIDRLKDGRIGGIEFFVNW